MSTATILKSVRAVLDAYNERDIDAIVDRSHADLQFISSFAGMEGGIYLGHKGIHAGLTNPREARLRARQGASRTACGVVVASGMLRRCRRPA